MQPTMYRARPTTAEFLSEPGGSMARYRVPPEWAAFGARFGRDGLLYLAEWRRGFTVHELRALFFDCQRARTLEREKNRLADELARAESEKEKAEALAAWYRRQLVLESRLGAMLARLVA